MLNLRKKKGIEHINCVMEVAKKRNWKMERMRAKWHTKIMRGIKMRGN